MTKNQAELRVLTPTAIAGHLACPHLTQLDRLRRAGQLKVALMIDPRLEAMQQRGRLHEAQYVDRLRAEGRKVRDLRDARDPADTLTAMQEGWGAIVQAPLGDSAFHGVADVLLRVDSPSALGGWSYEPADTKLALETKAGTILQLIAYCELLAPMQQLKPSQFHVVTPLAEERYRTLDFVAYFRFVRAQLLSAATRIPVPATYPDPVPHCDVCGYWKYCDDRRRADDHPSLVANIQTGQVRELQRQAITTLAGLAQCEGQLPEKPKRGSPETFLRLGHQARLQLQARITGQPPVEFLIFTPDRGLARLPEPSVGDVFLDFEGDPFVGAQGLEYLTGYAVRDAQGNVVYEDAWGLNANAEKAACERFIDFALEQLRQHPDMHIYHFGAYEPAALKRLCARHATRTEDLDRLLRGRRFIDLHTVVREGLRIGVERYGLKELEVLHGFRRAFELIEAAVARRDLELALELGEEVSSELRDQVKAYNRDDCLSTEALRTWLEQQRSVLVERGETVLRPQAGNPEPGEKVRERDQRINEMRERLLAGVPLEAENRSAEEQGRAHLASMLGYFRQEEKNAYWEHFRLRELPPDERLDEREMLASLEFIGVVPRQGRERNDRHLYRFPAQDTAIESGDKVYYTADEDPVAGPDAKGRGTKLDVENVDLAAGTLTIAMSKASEGRHPTAVFREQVVPADDLEESLLAFADRVCVEGFSSGAYSAASSLLLRRPPGPGNGDSLRHPGEDALTAMNRLCAALDGDVLPVQGPPGSGKTYAGARAILRLAKAGKRVGVTAVSHKVIDNLLVAVRDAAAKEGAVLRLVHKADGDAPTGIDYVKSAGAALAAVTPGTVVGGTAWLWAHDDALGSLDYLFVDEAGQMALAQALAAARATRNLVLLGDPQQLEQPTRGAHPEGADVAALVHCLDAGRVTLREDQGLFLNDTYRLHPDLCAFTSELYYEGRLQTVIGHAFHQLRGDTPLANGSLLLAEVPHEGNQAQAIEEVDAASRIVQSLLQPGITWIERGGSERPLRASDILVVAPYNAQVSALRRRLAALGVDRVGTVDKFQGQEAPVVLYSCTSSSAQEAPRGMPFLYDPHRFNVATSRAQGLVVVIASPKLFEPECRTPEQMRCANGLCRYRELATVAGF